MGIVDRILCWIGIHQKVGDGMQIWMVYQKGIREVVEMAGTKWNCGRCGKQILEVKSPWKQSDKKLISQ